MPIHFIPNDPLAVATMPMRQQRPRPDRPAGSAAFAVHGPVREDLYLPETPEFLFWQCRESALMALETWEALAGPLAAWTVAGTDTKVLPVLPNDGGELNAYYDREALRFFAHATAAKTTYTGASTDIVAHEVGHALLDAVRPELLDSLLPETNAFHEAFGDCFALLTALSDPETRAALLTAAPDLGRANFVEALLEDLADGFRRSQGADHPASEPRHALNDFRWQLPTTLPKSGPPAVLTGEEHSFGRVFAGCFYDTLRNIFQSFPNRTEETLWMAAQTTGRLLIAAARKAPETARFFQAVGRAMVLEDQEANGGAHHAALRDAFLRHGVRLGSSAMTAPRATLAGRAPRLTAAAEPLLSAATRRDLRGRLGALPRTRMAVVPVELGGEHLAKAVYYREVPLTGLAEALEGVVGMAPEPVLIGAVGSQAALMSPMPEPATTTDEVRSYVGTLLAADRIALPEDRPAVRRRGAAAALQPSRLPTHEIQVRGNRKVLVRKRFLCRGH